MLSRTRRLASRRSFLITVTGGLLGGAAAVAQTPPPRAFGCSDSDEGAQADPAWAHGADKDQGAHADPVLRHLFHDGSDAGATSDFGSHVRGLPSVSCPKKRQQPAR